MGLSEGGADKLLGTTNGGNRRGSLRLEDRGDLKFVPMKRR